MSVVEFRHSAMPSVGPVNPHREVKNIQIFSSNSVSAERWINVEEVRPTNLKEYLMKKKSDGYSIVAAEQTSNSQPLQKFKFPEKTLLLLGYVYYVILDYHDTRPSWLLSLLR